LAVKGEKIHSITLDNGSEFAAFREIEKDLGVDIYFAAPHSPRQRGSNENTNGLLRFYFPKGADFRAISDERVREVVNLINNRPRKCLGWLSPHRVC
jgi:IS30 family transposase